MMRWSLALLVVGLAGLILQADLGAAGEKKKPAGGGNLNVKSELTNKDDKDKIRTDSYCKIFTYKMVKGRTYQIDMKSKDIDSYLRLEDPDGKQVAFDDDGGGFPDARITYKAADSGDHKIIATTFGGNSTGAFTLTAVDKDASTSTDLKLDKGEATFSGKLGKDDPLYKNKRHKLITVELEAGKSYQIDMKSKDLDSYLFLESPDGELLAMDDDGGGFPDARIIHKAAKAGKYRIICTYFGGGGAGDFTLTVRASE